MANSRKKKNNIILDEESQITQADFQDVMEKNYIDYAMSVITERALADVRDNCKPVQRRVLYTMHELGLSPLKPHKKCARITGECMGKYHPHGRLYG